jgi:hypothetical protein
MSRIIAENSCLQGSNGVMLDILPFAAVIRLYLGRLSRGPQLPNLLLSPIRTHLLGTQTLGSFTIDFAFV